MLNSKVIYGVCDVQIFWSEHETPDGSEFCTLEKVLVGEDTKVELPVETEADKKYWSKECEKVAGISHHWGMKEAILDDIVRLEKYIDEETFELNQLGLEYLKEVKQSFL